LQANAGNVLAMARPRSDERAPYTSDKLTDVAVRVFNSRGYDATRMEHIANAANISKSSLYHHVSGKEALLEIALHRAIDALFATLELPGAQQGSATERLRFILRAVIETELHLVPEVSLLSRLRGNSAAEQWALSERRRYNDAMTIVVQAAQKEGALADGIDPALLTRLVLGMTNSLIDWFRPDGTWSSKQIADATLSIIFKPTEAKQQRRKAS
jgi:AcrR family transcriptional regulator